MCFVALFVTYLIVASLIAFFTVKIIGIPIGKRMFTKIVLSIAAFVPLYLVIAYLLSKFVSRDLLRLEKSIRNLPYFSEPPGSWIREVDRLSRVIRDQTKRIREMIEVQRLMIYRIAHDLRTPIANIRNVLTGIKDGIIRGEEVEEYLSRSIEEVDRVGSLLEEALSHIRKVSRRREVEEVDLCGFVRSLGKVWSLRFEKKGVELKVECSNRIVLKVSPLDLEEIMNNLLENALKNTDIGEVRVKVRREEDQVFITVEDTGRGIETGKLLEAYRRGSLGLYIVRELVWRNGGDMKVTSSEEGTRVVIRFPLS